MSNTMSDMLDKYDPGLVGGLFGALIAMALGKFVESIYMVYSCKKQVDSLDVLIRSVEPSLVVIQGENNNVRSQEEIRRAWVSIKIESEAILREWRTVSMYNVKALRHISKRSTHLISDIHEKMPVALVVAAAATVERLDQLVVAVGTAERGREERERVAMQRLEDVDKIFIDQLEESTEVWLGLLDEAVRVRQGRMEESERVWTERLEESTRVSRGRLEELERVWIEKLGQLERVKVERLGWLEESERVRMQQVEESPRISLEGQQELETISLQQLGPWNASPLYCPTPPLSSLMLKEDSERIRTYDDKDELSEGSFSPRSYTTERVFSSTESVFSSDDKDELSEES